MNITVTAAAVCKLKAMMLQEKYSPRIDANVAGGCGMSVKLTIVFDEPRRNDICMEYDGIQIRMDYFTQRYVDGETQIDYTDEAGFLVGDSFASSGCAIEKD